MFDFQDLRAAYCVENGIEDEAPVTTEDLDMLYANIKPELLN